MNMVPLGISVLALFTASLTMSRNLAPMRGSVDWTMEHESRVILVLYDGEMPVPRNACPAECTCTDTAAEITDGPLIDCIDTEVIPTTGPQSVNGCCEEAGCPQPPKPCSHQTNKIRVRLRSGPPEGCCATINTDSRDLDGNFEGQNGLQPGVWSDFALGATMTGDCTPEAPPGIWKSYSLFYYNVTCGTGELVMSLWAEYVCMTCVHP